MWKNQSQSDTSKVNEGLREVMKRVVKTLIKLARRWKGKTVSEHLPFHLASSLYFVKQ